jgi:hypothetical protein
VVHNDEIRAQAGSFSDDGRIRVDREQHPVHGRLGSPTDQPHRVPLLCQLRGVATVQQGDDTSHRQR